MASLRVGDIAFPEDAVFTKKLQGAVGAAQPGTPEAHALLLGLLVVVGQLECRLARLERRAEVVQESLDESAQLADVIREIFPDGS